MNVVEIGAAAAEGGALVGEQRQHYRREGQNSGTGDHVVMAEAKHGAREGGNGKRKRDGASKSHCTGDHAHSQQSGDSKVKSVDSTGVQTNQAARPSGATNGSNVGETNHILYIGTLSYSEQEGSRRQHQIRGNWKYKNSPPHAIPERFELTRAIPPDDDLKELPKDGQYHGTFSLTFEFTTPEGEKKTKRKRVTESGVIIKFTKKAGPGVFSVKGKGVNGFGKFELVGTATKSKMKDDPRYRVRLKKIYTVTTHPPAQQQQSSAEPENLKSRKKSSAIEAEPREEATSVKPPPPTVLPPINLVCLRGKLSRNTSENLSLGLRDVIHKITGIWSTGLNHNLDDPDNTKALCNEFDYEHKCSGTSTVFPKSGKYTGWFYVSAEDGSNTKTKICERDVMLKFIENSEGYHNVEGKGSNIYGEYTISGTLDAEGIITLFRHFQPRKFKVSNKKSRLTTLTTTTPAPGLLNASRDKKAALSPIPPMGGLQLSFDDVEAPDGSELVPVVQAPLIYGAVSEGIFKITDDGHHFFSGNWAITFEQLLSGTATRCCHFEILPDIAAEDAKTMLERMDRVGATDHDDRRINIPDSGVPTMLNYETFPIDSVRYMGSFQMRKGILKTTVRDDQIVLKFVKNTSGSYNVYGKGKNNIGFYDIVGTLILHTTTSGHLVLYRMHPNPLVLAVPEHIPPATVSLMEKCRQILRDLQGKDVNSMFAIPFDPKGLEISNYSDIIKNPMDLGTINSRLESGELDSPEEFIRLVRLVFENAVTVNTVSYCIIACCFGSVARRLLAFFNSKIGTVEHVLVCSQKNKKLTKAELIDRSRKEKDPAKDSIPPVQEANQCKSTGRP